MKVVICKLSDRSTKTLKYCLCTCHKNQHA